MKNFCNAFKVLIKNGKIQVGSYVCYVQQPNMYRLSSPAQML